jgi:hypothetical protein
MTDEKKKNPYEEIHADLPQPSGYKVIGSDGAELPEILPEEPEPIIFPVEPPVEEAKPAKAPFSLSFLSAEWNERLRKFAQNPTRVYAAAGIGLGILFGVIIGVVVWNSAPEGRYDLGMARSSAAGLRGHLFVEWDKRVKYRLTIEPEDTGRQAGFALAVASSPQPLSVNLQLQDSQGFVLCGKDILLKFDARGAAALTATAPVASTDGVALPTGQPAQTTDFAQQDAREAAREKGQDLFQNRIGADGMIASLSAQGEISCSKSAYEKTMLWSFTPDFPSLAEQDALLNRQRNLQAKVTLPPPPSRSAARKKIATLAPLPYTIEGDDAIVEFDPSYGLIETRGRKLFLIDKAAAAAASSAWQDFPVNIHFHCDQMSNCTLMHSGLGSLRVKMSR